MGEGRSDEEVASSKKKPKWKLECKNWYPIYDQNGGKMAKIDTQFMTKTAEKSAAHPYLIFLGVPSPRGLFYLFYWNTYHFISKEIATDISLLLVNVTCYFAIRSHPWYVWLVKNENSEWHDLKTKKAKRPCFQLNISVVQPPKVAQFRACSVHCDLISELHLM